MASDSKPTRKELWLSTHISSQFTKLSIRTNLVLLRPMKIYIPDDDNSVPYVFALGRHTISTADGHEEALLSGYFSAMCAVLPDLTSVARKFMENLGFQAKEILIPSQATRMNIEIPPCDDLRLEALKFVQMCFLPFQYYFDDNMVNGFWNKVAAGATLEYSSCSKLFCSASGMKTISSALLVSGLRGELRSRIASTLKGLAAKSALFARILSEARYVNMYDPSSYRHLYSIDVNS